MNETRKKRFINATLNIIMKNRPLLLILCATVVFVTTYLLILPAVTLEEQEAAKQGGIDVPSAELTFEGAGYAVRAGNSYATYKSARKRGRSKANAGVGAAASALGGFRGWAAYRVGDAVGTAGARYYRARKRSRKKSKK